MHMPGGMPTFLCLQLLRGLARDSREHHRAAIARRELELSHVRALRECGELCLDVLHRHLRTVLEEVQCQRVQLVILGEQRPARLLGRLADERDQRRDCKNGRGTRDHADDSAAGWPPGRSGANRLIARGYHHPVVVLNKNSKVCSPNFYFCKN